MRPGLAAATHNNAQVLHDPILDSPHQQNYHAVLIYLYASFLVSDNLRHYSIFRSDRLNHCRYNGDFSIFKMAVFDVLGLFDECLDDPRRVLLVGLFYSAKFDLNQCSSFGNNLCKFKSLHRTLGLEMPIHTPKISFFLGAGFETQNGKQYERHSKRHILAQTHVA